MNEKTLFKRNKYKPCVDVILPNYNKSKFLEEAINSVIMHRLIRIGTCIL